MVCPFVPRRGSGCDSSSLLTLYAEPAARTCDGRGIGRRALPPALPLAHARLARHVGSAAPLIAVPNETGHRCRRGQNWQQHCIAPWDGPGCSCDDKNGSGSAPSARPKESARYWTRTPWTSRTDGFE
ncbi:uncharacterized protein SPSK_01302 [Sporothrix schenckii 1099-18]|uniref:Uncharacterized protein n=1 Tax=Sporothrix schenckii 1099-18 TaxID=1397361 RepID=A0A0F2LVH6_SPOSC|nr:uncharacterized protein SPSK_01302 [Sporothrix schenckii 1099-18]KJR81448.1 hypothetical protein SPSK_01302 [Sporothrix schenckii 1099-18]